jgi:hypothetical protein
MTDLPAKPPFDWGPLPEKWYREVGSDRGADDRPIMFAAAVVRGASHTLAAYEAGYSPCSDPKGVAMRNAGLRASRTGVVRDIIAMAMKELGIGDDEADDDFDEAARHRALVRMAKHGDPNIKLRAMDLLAKEDEREAKERERTADMRETLIAIRRVDDVVARFLCDRYGIPLPEVPEDEQSPLRPFRPNGEGEGDRDEHSEAAA